MHSTCAKEQFKKNLMLRKEVYCFYHFWFLIKICSVPLRKSFGTVVKTAFHVYRWSFRERRTNLLNNTKICFFLRIWASNLRSLVWKLHAQLSKLHSTCTKGQFEKKLTLGKTFTVSITFEFYSKNVRSFCRKISARWSKLHFTSGDDHSKKEQNSRIKQNF